MNSLSLSHIVKEFSGHNIIPELDLEVHPKEFLSLVGPSGCGKTTLLRMIAGLDRPSQGTILIDSEIVFDSSKHIFVPPEKRNLGMVFQNYALWPHLTVMENIAFPLNCQKLARTEIRNRCEEILKLVKLTGLDHRLPSQLSGGQQQRVALARALVSTPRLVLLDEPLSNLDTHLREEMCDQISSLRKIRPMTMIYVTHSLKEAYRLSDRIAVLNQGRVEQLGTPRDLQDSPNSEFVRNFMKSAD